MKDAELQLVKLLLRLNQLEKEKKHRKKLKSERNKRYYRKHREKILQERKKMRDLYKAVKQKSF